MDSYQSAVRSLIPWAIDWLKAQSLETKVILFGTLFVLAIIALHMLPSGHPSKAPVKKVPTRTRRFPWELLIPPVLIIWLIWKIIKTRTGGKTKTILWRLGNVTVDLRGGRDTIHAAVGGMTGSGKSYSIIPLLECPGPALVIAFDNTYPIQKWFEANGEIVWKTDGDMGWDILRGSPQIVSESLTAGFAKTDKDTGYFRGLARMRLWRAIADDDANGRPRDLWRYIVALRERSGDPEEDRACRAWANRFQSIAMSLGPALGSDFDLATALRYGRKVLILPNRFLSPEDAPLVGAMALVQGRRVAQEVGGFPIIVEEAGQAGSRREEMNALAQAGRDRGCPLVVITQNLRKLPEEVVNNISVWVVFAQESDAEIRFAVARMRGLATPEDFDRDSTLPVGHCWVRAPGVSARRIKLPQSKFKTRRPATQAPSWEVTVRPGGTRKDGSYRIIEENPAIDGWINSLPLMLPAGGDERPPSWIGLDVNRLRVWGYLKRSGNPVPLWSPERGVWWDERGCLEWTKSDNGGGRPKTSIDGASETVYVLTWNWKYGTVPADRPTLDHCCDNTKCCDPDHLEPVTIRENNARKKPRKLALIEANNAGYPGGAIAV